MFFSFFLLIIRVYLRLSVVNPVLLNSVLGFVFLTRLWRPAYRLLRMLLGNKDLPDQPMPRASLKSGRPDGERHWWYFLPGILWLLSILALLYFAIKSAAK